MKINTKKSSTITTTIELTGADIMELLLRCSKISPSAYEGGSTVKFEVPQGMDRTGSGVDITAQTPITITCTKNSVRES